MKSVS